ncbi:MAG: mechanosensitive ion channel family protein [Cyclobacteriaceae bacterium]
MKYFLTIILLITALTASARQADSTDYNLSSPYYTIYTFLNNLQEDNYNPEISAKAFLADSEIKAQRSAIQLKQILDGEGLYIEMEDIPREKNYYDSAVRKSRFILNDRYPGIFIERRGNRWIFPKLAVLEIEKVHNDVFGFGMSYLLEWLPKLGTQKIAGLHIWQAIALLGIIFFSFLLHKILTIIFQKLIIGYLRRSKFSELADMYVSPVARPLSVFIVLSIVLLFVPVLQLPIFFSKWVILVLRVSVPVFITIVCYKLVDLLSFYFKKLAEKTKSSLDDQLVPLISKALRLFIVIVGIFFVLLKLNVDIIPLLTGFSIGGLAFALAAQDTIKNFFGSLMIFIDKPFQIGDWITSGDIDGTVEEVGFRSTRVRTFRNSVTYVPNGVMADSTIDNHGLRIYRRFYTQIAVTYDTPTHLIEVFVEGLRKLVDNHPDTRKEVYEIYLNGMGDSSLNIMFYIFFKVPSWSEELRARHEILIKIIDLANELGVNFAFPTQTLHMETFPGQNGLSPVYDNTRQQLQQKMNQFVAGSLPKSQ